MSSQKMTTKFGRLAAGNIGRHAKAKTASKRRNTGFIGRKPSVSVLGVNGRIGSVFMSAGNEVKKSL